VSIECGGKARRITMLSFAPEYDVFGKVATVSGAGPSSIGQGLWDPVHARHR